jgi:integrase
MKYSTGWCKRRGSGDKWIARFSYYEEVDGRRIKREKARTFVAKSDRAARQETTRIHEELEAEALLAKQYPESLGADRDLYEYMSSYIDAREGSHMIERTTAANYRASAKLVRRYLRDRTVGSISSASVLKMDELLLADELAPDTVSKVHRFLKQVLAEAVDEGIITTNPITRSTRPPKRQRHEPNGLDEATVGRLLGIIDDMDDTQITLAIRLGLLCGLRNEEVCGLKWGDVDLVGGIVTVRRAITVAGGHVLEKDPKTEKGRRDIPLDPDLAGRLGARLAATGLSPIGAKDTYVLGSVNGSFYNPTMLIRDFRSLARNYGIFGTTGMRASFYSLRHTYATMLLRAGVDVKTVAELMGHASAKMTLDVYATTDVAAKRDTASVISDAMAKWRESNRNYVA